MRISDWSSDVCSSDLRFDALAQTVAAGLGIAGGLLIEQHQIDVRTAPAPERVGLQHRFDHAQILAVANAHQDDRPVAGNTARPQYRLDATAAHQVLARRAQFQARYQCRRPQRSAERRVGKEWVSTCRTRWEAYL